MLRSLLVAAYVTLILPALVVPVGAQSELSVSAEESPRLRGTDRRRLLDEGSGKSWRDRVKEKGETVFQEKKRAAIRAACYKDWKPGCRRIVEWAKKTGRVQGAEQQELLEFARKTLEAAEKDGDIFKPAASKKRGAEEEPEEVPPLPKAESKKPAAPLVDGDMSFDPDQSSR